LTRKRRRLLLIRMQRVCPYPVQDPRYPRRTREVAGKIARCASATKQIATARGEGCGIFQRGSTANDPSVKNF